MPVSKLFSKFSNDKDATNTVSVYSFDSPIGKVIGAADENCLYIVTFGDAKNCERSFQTLCDKLSCRLIENKNSVLKQLEHELAAYFDGKLKKFTVPIKTLGSEFQQAVWSKLLELPYGSTQSYGDLAKSLGRSASHARAIGAACGANSLLVVIPCHRLVASHSSGGFNSGVDRKQWLIDHERKDTD